MKKLKAASFVMELKAVCVDGLQFCVSAQSARQGTVLLCARLVRFLPRKLTCKSNVCKYDSKHIKRDLL
jgi:hypothetical protein